MIKKLKIDIETQFGREIRYSKDCEQLAKVLFDTTKRKVSAATLRRFWGLLSTHTRPSKYTLDTLAVYIGFSDFSAYEDLFEGNANSTWEKVSKVCRSITNYTVTNIANSSLTDFRKVISRDYLNQQFEDFISSEKTLTALVAPSGYGKSITLAKWISDKESSNNIVLFVHSSTCISLFDYTSEQFADISLNINNQNSTLQYLLSHPTEIRGKFILVIDALDELFYQPSKLKQFYKQLIDLSQQDDLMTWFKVVFSVRESIYNEYLQKESSIETLANYYALDKYYSTLSVANIAPLSDYEIILLIGKTAYYKYFDLLSLHVKEFLRIPINFNLFTQYIHDANGDAVISVVSLFRNVFNTTVFQSSFSEEKQDIIWKVIELISTDYCINKSTLKDMFSIHLKTEGSYYYAYQELLQQGIFTEEHNPNRYGFTNIKVRFKHSSFFHYLYSLKLVDNNGALDSALLLSVAKSELPIELKINLITYLYQLAYDDNNYDAISNIWDLDSEIIQSSAFRNTVGTCLRNASELSQRLINHYALSPIAHYNYFTRFVDINYLNKGYERQLEAYSKSHGAMSQLFLDATLYYSDFLRMDVDSCINRYQNLTSSLERNDEGPYPLGRKHAYMLLHKYFVSHEKISLTFSELKQMQKTAYNNDLDCCREQFLYEITVSLALLLVGDYVLLRDFISHAFHSVLEKKLDTHQQFIRRYHVAILEAFYCFASYKEGEGLTKNMISHCEYCMTTFIDVKDSFQYMIMICLFLMEYHKDDIDKQTLYFEKGLSISRGANYPFFERLIHESEFNPTLSSEG